MDQATSSSALISLCRCRLILLFWHLYSPSVWPIGRNTMSKHHDSSSSTYSVGGGQPSTRQHIHHLIFQFTVRFYQQIQFNGKIFWLFFNIKYQIGIVPLQGRVVVMLNTV